MQHPLHAHRLFQVDPLLIYQSSRGHWRCDNCNRESGPSFGRPYHCSTCSYDLCQTCINSHQPHVTQAHQHALLYMNTSMLLYQESHGAWRCDSCQGLSTDLQQSHSYHCGICSFDLCQSCFEPKTHPVHCHPIRKADTKVAYPGTSGNWMCDVCGIASRPLERFSYHCAECQFDVCDKCFDGCESPHHNHRLVKADSRVVYGMYDGGWRCDRCGSIHNDSANRWPWHCQQCEFDLCDNCMRSSRPVSPGFRDVVGPPIRLSISSGHRGFRASENPWAIRQEVSTSSVHSPSDGPVEFRSERGNAVTYPDDTNEAVVQEARRTQVAKETRGTEGTDDSETCIICLEQPKNATLIHGDTGHCCCCWACGQVLKRRNDPCPICRAPIERVIRQYNS